MKIFLGLVFLSFSAFADIVISEKQNDNFGGYYVEVEATQKGLAQSLRRDVTIADALNVQKNLRDCLQERSKSFFRLRQEPYLAACSKKAEASASTAFSANSSEGGVNIVFDMDETLLTQWHLVGRDHPEKTTFIAKNLDVTLSEKDMVLTKAPTGVSVRPGAVWLLSLLNEQPRIGRIFFFSAREDKSAEELAGYFLDQVPTLKKKYGGLFARNHLRFDATTTTPSKDLRLISPSLKNVLLVDDNPARVIQKELNFSIPKFNADLYHAALDSNDLAVIKANKGVMPYVYQLLILVSSSRDTPGAFSIYSTKYAEEKKIDWGAKILTWIGFHASESKVLLDEKVFIQDYVKGEVVKQ
jgi:NLI interacting factor-like phosphatase